MTMLHQDVSGRQRAPQPRRRINLSLVLLVLVLIVPPLVAEPLDLTKLSRLVVLVLAVLGVNLLTGYTGLISLGHGVFVGVGAFAMANFIDWGISLYLAGFLATVFAGVVGLLLGLPALRIKGIYLALVTFGIALAFGPVARRLGSWTGGTSGRTVNNDAFVPPSFLGLDDHVHIWRYGVCLAVVGVWFWITRNLVNSRIGRALRTVRDNEPAAATFGVNVRNAKIGALAVSSAMAGTAGALQVILNPYVGFSDFDAFLSLRLYAAAVIGGLGTLAGAVYGVIALIVVPSVGSTWTWLETTLDPVPLLNLVLPAIFQVLDWLYSAITAIPFVGTIIGNFLDLFRSESVLFGAGLVIMTFLAPSGIAGLIKDRGRGKSSPS